MNFQSPRATRSLTIIAIVFILFELQYAFKQYLHAPLDGDFVSICLPADNYDYVLKDPLGFEALIHQTSYSATNRFFSHFSMKTWFDIGQKITEKLSLDPIEGIFWTSAVFSWLMHIVLAWMLLKYITCVQNIQKISKIWLFAAILTFFHFGGPLYVQIGIIDKSITYTFFYALPIFLLMSFYYPFYKRYFEDKKIKWSEHLFLSICVFVLPFFGGFMAPLILYCNTLILAAIFYQRRNTPFCSLQRTTIIYLLLIQIWCLYSFYIGTFNNENSTEIALIDRYPILIKGIWMYFTDSYIFYIIFGLLAYSYVLVVKERPRIRLYYIIAGIIIGVYIFILPLGGYRSYRPWILRYDVMLPVTLVFIWAILVGCIQVFKKNDQSVLKSQMFWIYVFSFISIGISDYHRYNKSDYQRKELTMIQQASSGEMLHFQSNEPLWIWSTEDYNDFQHQNVTNYLKKWKILSSEKEIFIHYQ